MEEKYKKLSILSGIGLGLGIVSVLLHYGQKEDVKEKIKKKKNEFATDTIDRALNALNKSTEHLEKIKENYK